MTDAIRMVIEEYQSAWKSVHGIWDVPTLNYGNGWFTFKQRNSAYRPKYRRRDVEAMTRNLQAMSQTTAYEHGEK